MANITFFDLRKILCLFSSVDLRCLPVLVVVADLLIISSDKVVQPGPSLMEGEKRKTRVDAPTQVELRQVARDETF